MSLQDLGQGDFEYFVKYADQMRTCHEEEFKKKIDPDLLRAMYRGKMTKEKDKMESQDDTKHMLAFSRLFQATNTIVPNLLYQMPSPIVTPLRNSDQESSALMASILKHYMKLNRSKQQNQESILNAWFFGIGWKKIGWRTVFMPKSQEPETQIDQNLLDKTKSAVMSMFGKPDNTESKERPEVVDYETLFNDSENPMNVMLDHKADLLNTKAILHRIPRTIHDLQNYGDYDPELLKELEEKMRDKFGTRFDSRDSELDFNELHVQQRNGIWILSWCDGYSKPLRYDKSTYQGKGFTFVPLTFTYEPGVRYPISHMKVASQVQVKQDKLATMFVELMARSVNLTVVNEKALAPGQKDALEKNLLRGILSMKDKFSAQDIQSFSAGSVPPELKTLMTMLQQNITEILGSDEQAVAGQSQNETLGQDELARVGTKTRETGMRDKVADFIVDQLKIEGTLVKQFSDSELHIQITGKDYSDPMTAERVEDKWVSFMTPENPLGAKHFLQGEFEYDVNIEEAIRPNKQAQRQQLIELITASSQPGAQDALLEDNAKLRSGLLWKELIKTFDAVGNPDKFIEPLDPRQVAAIQTKKLLMQGGMPQPFIPKPSDVGGEGSEQGVSHKSSAQAQ